MTKLLISPYTVKAVRAYTDLRPQDSLYIISRDGQARCYIAARELSLMSGPPDPDIAALRAACARGKVIQFKAA